MGQVIFFSIELDRTLPKLQEAISDLPLARANTHSIFVLSKHFAIVAKPMLKIRLERNL